MKMRRIPLLSLIVLFGAACATEQTRTGSIWLRDGPFRAESYVFEHVVVNSPAISTPRLVKVKRAESKDGSGEVGKVAAGGFAYGAAAGLSECLSESLSSGYFILGVFAAPFCAVVGGVGTAVTSVGLEVATRERSDSKNIAIPAEPSEEQQQELLGLNESKELKLRVSALPTVVDDVLENGGVFKIANATQSAGEAVATRKGRATLFVTLTNFGFSHSGGGPVLRLTGTACVELTAARDIIVMPEGTVQSSYKQYSAWAGLTDDQFNSEVRALTEAFIREVRRALYLNGQRYVDAKCSAAS